MHKKSSQPATTLLMILLQVYSRYGQYSYVNINQVVTPRGLQTVSNVLTLLTGWLAVCQFFVHAGDEVVSVLTTTPSLVLQRGYEDRLR